MPVDPFASVVTVEVERIWSSRSFKESPQFASTVVARVRLIG